MKVIGIIGSRRRQLQSDITAIETALLAQYEDGDHIVSGGCPSGGDHFAEWLAKKHQIPITIHYARWKKYGKSAGFVRNSDIATEADILIACVAPDRTGGTEHTIETFQKLHPKGQVILV
jgi:hypothetical protein